MLLLRGALLVCTVILLQSVLQTVSADDKIKELIKSLGYVEIKLVEAQVPDLDPLPMQRDSDVFVRVYLNDTKELVCETPVVQDENKPKVSFYNTHMERDSPASWRI